MLAGFLIGMILQTVVTFSTPDDVRIEAIYRAPDRARPAATPAAILVPMYLRDRSTWDDFARAAAEEGVATLAIDPRGHGASANPTGRPPAEWGGREWLGVLTDIQAARRFLIERGHRPERIVLVGASIGASLALEAAVADETVAGLALLSLSTNLSGQGPGESIVRYGDRPLFVAFSLDDSQFAESSARMFLAARGPAEVRRYRRAGHGTDMFGGEDRPGDLTRSLVRWIHESVGDGKR